MSQKKQREGLSGRFSSPVAYRKPLFLVDRRCHGRRAQLLERAPLGIRNGDLQRKGNGGPSVRRFPVEKKKRDAREDDVKVDPGEERASTTFCDWKISSPFRCLSQVLVVVLDTIRPRVPFRYASSRGKGKGPAMLHTLMIGQL